MQLPLDAPSVGYMSMLPSVTSPTTGKRKALLIGINYTIFGNAGFTLDLPRKHFPPLFGGHIDAQCMKNFLMTHRNWPEESITMMIDRPDVPLDHNPTRENILRQFEKLAEEARPGDHLFLQFSGHGDQIPDQDFDEVDGMDEIIIAADGQIITDDEMHELLVRRIPAGCKMSVIFDCCSSGTALDLPIFPDKSVFLDTPIEMYASPMSMTESYMSTDTESNFGYSPTGQRRGGHRLLPQKYYTDEPESLPLPSSPNPLILDLPFDPSTPSPYASPHFLPSNAPPTSTKHYVPPSGPHPNIHTTGYRPPIRKKYSSGDVVMWSACRDYEEAGELQVSGENVSRGAMTLAFIESMTSNEYIANPTYQTLLDCIRTKIHNYQLPRKQHVQFSSSYELNPETDYQI